MFYVKKMHCRNKWIWWDSLVVAGVLCVSIAGCITYSQNYTVSTPDVRSAGLSLVEKNILQKKHNVIELDGLQFSAKPFNAKLVSKINSWFLFIPIPFHRIYPDEERFGGHTQSVSSPFLIEIAFRPTKGDLKVDPSQIVLHLNNQDYKPSQMAIPSEAKPMRSFGGRYSQALGLCFRSGNLRLEEMLRSLQQVQIPIGEGACVWLSFDVAPPLPETEFSVSIKGIEMAGKPVEIPSLRFVEGNARLIDAIP